MNFVWFFVLAKKWFQGLRDILIADVWNYVIFSHSLSTSSSIFVQIYAMEKQVCIEFIYNKKKIDTLYMSGFFGS